MAASILGEELGPPFRRGRGGPGGWVLMGEPELHLGGDILVPDRADPAERLSFGYAMNRMGDGVLLNPRGQALIDAVYRALGYTTDAPGVWIR